MTFDLHDLIILALAVFVSSYLQSRKPKQLTDKPADTDMGTEMKAINARIDTKASELSTRIDDVDGKVDRLAESTTDAIDSLLQRQRDE